MNPEKDHELKRKFGNNLSNKENEINFPVYKNIKNNITKNNFHKISKKNSKTQINVPSSHIIHIKKRLIPISKPNQSNPQDLPEYFQEIIKNIKSTEPQNILNYSINNIFSLQDTHFINEKERKHIIESLIYQNYIWKLNPDSIYLTVNIMDRYINKNKISSRDYELIGLASFLIGSKYEDIYSPDAESLTKIFDFKYHYKYILEKESQILQSLEYNLMYISSYKILNLIYHLSKINDINVKNFANMILDFSLTDLNIMKYSQIKRAVACFLFAKKIFGIKSGNNIIKLLFSYDDNEMEKIVKKLFILLKDVVMLNQEQNLIAEKYRSSRFNSIFSVFEKKLNEKIKMRIKAKVA